MTPNIDLTFDPFEGARLALFALKPDATDQDWEDYVGRYLVLPDQISDDWEALAILCREALREVQMDAATREHIACAEGFCRAMHLQASAMAITRPTSPRMPHHLKANREGFLRSTLFFRQ